MNLFTFDINMNNLGFVNPDEVISATLDDEINQAFTMIIELPLTADLPDETRFMATPHPKYKGEYQVGQLARKQVESDRVTYTFREYFYQQLDKGVISVQKPNYTDKPVKDVLNFVLSKEAIQWDLVEVMDKKISIYLYYDSGLEVFQRVQEQLGGEYVFTCEIDPKNNKLVNHKVRYIESQGRKTGKRFERDTNLLTIVGDVDYNNIINLIYPRGKGVEVDNPDAPKNAPTGYGRRLTIKEVNPPDPSDPMYNGEYIWDKEATKIWGNMYANRREEVVIYEDITDPQTLYDAGMRTLNERNHPNTVFSASVSDIDDLELGDEVFIIWRSDVTEHKMEYSTRVFAYHYDLLNPANNTLQLGDQRKDGTIGSTLAGMNRRIENAQNVATWAGQTLIGPDAGYGDTLPSLDTKPREGDTFYLKLDSGLTDMYIFIGGQWIKKASSDATDFANSGKLNGNNKVFFGEVDPVSPVDGDTWLKYKGTNVSEAVMYIMKGSEWIEYKGITDANGLLTGSIDATKVQLENVDANSITSGAIDAGEIPLENLDADKITVGSIDSSKIRVYNLNASEIGTGTLNASIVNVINLNANNITSGVIDASKINVTNISANNITSGSIDASKIQVVNLDAGNINAGSLSADRISGGTIDASKINVVNLNASQITTGELNTANINIVNDSTDTALTLSNGLFINRKGNGNYIASLTEGGLTMYDDKGRHRGSIVPFTTTEGNYLHMMHGNVATGVSLGSEANVKFAVDNFGTRLYSRIYVNAQTTSGAVFSTISWSDLNNGEKMLTLANAYGDLKPRGGIAFAGNGKVYAYNIVSNTRKEISNW